MRQILIAQGNEAEDDHRVGLDADHISAIDNATRQLVSLGQLPITCGELKRNL